VSYRLKRNVVMALVAVGVLAGAYLFATREGAPPPRGLAPVGDDPFGSGDTVPGPHRGVLSPDGTRLAVLSADGLGVVERNEIRPLTSEGANVVDVAWFGNGGTLLVAEGPVPTGGLVVMDIDGTVRGTVPLQPTVGFGGGRGMSVAPGGRAAVVTAIERPALGGERSHLVAVDLETGETKALTPPDGPDEERPFHLDAGRVAFVERPAEGGPGIARTLVLDLATGRTEELATRAEVVGVSGDGTPVLLDEASRIRVADRVLGTVPAGADLVSIDAPSGQAVVVEVVDAVDGSRTSRLRRIEVDPAP
jgi:hypothetical protein